MQSINKCKQCGEWLPNSKFRKYYHREGASRLCLKCEKINSRAKYLERKGDKATDSEIAELSKIHQLYEHQRAAGLNPPKRRRALQDSLDEVDALISRYQDAATTVPEALQRWLTCELSLEPDYYLDEVYDELVKAFRPAIGFDKQKLQPVYDETHADTLNKILERFNAYEDKYYTPIGGTE